MNKKMSKHITSTGLLLSAFALLISTLLGFGGFSLQSFGSYVITGYVSKLQMVFLILVGLGLILSGIGYTNQAKKQKIKNPNLILLLHIAVSTVFFAMAIFGLTAPFRDPGFWEETTFVDIQSTLLFNNLTLTSFLAIGALQVILSIIFFKTKMLPHHQLSRAAKGLTLISGILLIVKAVIDYPLIKEAIFILSYMLKIPFPNNILSIVAPTLYLVAQIHLIIILRHNLKHPAH
ncbi:MAG: hypothetical protein JSV05_04275 [Candidatus Bathyarchaeota archaeon]|nr:MAG: hypothetical protein JSV05_04275 [Candidatus Bathyarchaeota archaeon]